MSKARVTKGKGYSADNGKDERILEDGGGLACATPTASRVESSKGIEATCQTQAVLSASGQPYTPRGDEQPHAALDSSKMSQRLLSAPVKVKTAAAKKAEFAASSLDFGDVISAKRFLQEALNLIQDFDT